MHLSMEELRAYNESEREKWNCFFRSRDSSVFGIPVQQNGAFQTVWQLIDHIFVVERRHLQRLRSQYPLPDSTSAVTGNWNEIWEYGRTSRAGLVELITSLTEIDENTQYPVLIMGETRLITPRKILFHVFLHEIRHWAQISMALRNAGLEPPKDQDLIFSCALI